MWFSPLKGAHLTLGQLDKTLPVDIAATGNDTIERGSFVYIQAYDTTGSAKLTPPRFSLYTATEAAKPNAVPYIALMGVKDFQAGMAGNIGQVTKAKGAADAVDGTLTEQEATFLNKSFTKDDQKFTGPRITAISVVQPAEYQTTAFDATQTYYVGQPLTIAAGKLTPFTGGQNIVGYVTAEPFTRWINDLGASEDGARISGGNAKVIEFSTAWIPVASTGAAGTDGAGKAPGALSVGAPKVAATEVKAPAAPAAPAPAAANKLQGAPAAGNNPQGK